MPSRRRQTGGAPLQNRLALHRFVCREFGYEDMGEMLAQVARAPGEIDAAGGESEFFRALYLTPAARVTLDRFAEYDADIGALSRRLRMTGEHGRTWKPHQYLALLFTEHYLRRYFDDAEALRADLNQAKFRHRPTSGLPTTRRTTFVPSPSRARPAPARRSSCTPTSSSTGAISTGPAGG